MITVLQQGDSRLITVVGNNLPGVNYTVRERGLEQKCFRRWRKVERDGADIKYSRNPSYSPGGNNVQHPNAIILSHSSLSPHKYFPQKGISIGSSVLQSHSREQRTFVQTDRPRKAVHQQEYPASSTACWQWRLKIAESTGWIGVHFSTNPLEILWSGNYDTIRDAILTCVQKLTWVSLIYRKEPTIKKWKTEKTKK